MVRGIIGSKLKYAHPPILFYILQNYNIFLVFHNFIENSLNIISKFLCYELYLLNSKTAFQNLKLNEKPSEDELLKP